MNQGTPITTSFVDIRRENRDITIEYQFIEADSDAAPIIIFLHEGLGSISMWRQWPEQVCRALNCRGLVYSRYGYGQSTPRLPNVPHTSAYLHDEAYNDLPALLTALALNHEKVVLYGHSDGGSIALLFAARYPELVHAIAVAAPHIFIEDITIKGIQDARQIYANTDFASRLARHHRDPDSVFRSWNDAWLTPEFRQWNIESVLGQIRCPVLAIQGVDDEYGTLEQIKGIQRGAPQTRLCIIPDCGHSPHRDQSETVIHELGQFLQHIRTDTP